MNEFEDSDEREVEEIDLDAADSVSHHTERDAALAAVLRHEAQRAEMEELYRERVEKQTTSLGPRHAALAVSLVLTVWVWLFPPALIQIPEVPPPPVAEEEATLRLVMYFQAQKVEQFVIENGRTPDELADAGPTFPGMDYVKLTDRHYRILGRTDRLTLSLSSAESSEDFIGAGASVLNLEILQ